MGVGDPEAALGALVYAAGGSIWEACQAATVFAERTASS
jgi:hypothetical protein